MKKHVKFGVHKYSEKSKDPHKSEKTCHYKVTSMSYYQWPGGIKSLATPICPPPQSSVIVRVSNPPLYIKSAVFQPGEVRSAQSGSSVEYRYIFCRLFARAS